MTLSTSSYNFSPTRAISLVLLAVIIAISVFVVDIQLRPTPLTLTPEEEEYIAAKPVIRAALDFEFQPLQYVDDRGQPAGMTYDFLRHIAAKAGFHLEVVPGTWAQGIERVRNGSLDLLGDASPTDERKIDFAFTEPLSHHTTHLYVQEHIVDIDDLADLAGRKVAFMASTSSLEAVKKHPDITAVEFPVTIDQLRALQHGTVDAAVGYDLQFRYVMFKNKVHSIKKVGNPVSTEEGCFMVRKEDTLLLSILNKGISSLSLEERQRIEQKWLSETSFTPTFKDFIHKYRHLGYLVAFIMILMVLWNLYLHRRVRKQFRDLKDSASMYRTMFETASDSILVIQDGIITDINHRCSEWIGAERSQIIGRNVLEFCPAVQSFGQETKQYMDDAYALAEAKKQFSFELEAYNAKGELRLAEINLSSFRTEQGLFFLAFGRDITERNQAAQEIKRQRAYFKQLFENSPLGIAIVDNEEKILDVSHGFQEMFGFTQQQAKGHTLSDLLVPEQFKPSSLQLSSALSQGAIVQRETTRQRHDGSLVDVFITAYPIMFQGERHGSYCIYTNISERKKAERKLEHQNLHDRLTGLPNRVHLQGRIAHSMERAKRSPNYRFALLYIDLDRFKVINDSLGHEVGDQLITAVGMRLRDTVRGVDTISRVGGDEFTVLMEEDVTDQSALSAAKRIQQAFRRSIRAGEHEIHSSTSIGIVMGPPSHDRADFMLRDAEIAMHQAKKKGKDGLEVFRPSMQKHAVKTMQLETDLRAAVEEENFTVHYQPIMNIATGMTAGYEALVRWNHPHRGKVYPDEFIPLAEDTGLIIPLGEQVLKTACLDFNRWQLTYPGNDNSFMSVNLSARQFSQKGLAGRIATILEETGLDPRNLRLEITESVVMENVHLASDILDTLKSIGVRISIDDFGTGYSSLSYLHRFPVSTLKVDRSFVMRMGSGEEYYEIVRTIIQLAHNLGMEVVAEGVEEISHETMLGRMECDYAQGYLYSRPVNAAGIEAMLTAQSKHLES